MIEWSQKRKLSLVSVLLCHIQSFSQTTLLNVSQIENCDTIEFVFFKDSFYIERPFNISVDYSCDDSLKALLVIKLKSGYLVKDFSCFFCNEENRLHPTEIGIRRESEYEFVYWVHTQSGPTNGGLLSLVVDNEIFSKNGNKSKINLKLFFYDWKRKIRNRRFERECERKIKN